MWVNGFCMIHLVSERFGQNVNIKYISFSDLGKIGEQTLLCHAGMCGENRMGTCTTDGKGCAHQMADTHIQYRGIGAVVNGQVDINGGNLHISHNTAAPNQ